VADLLAYWWAHLNAGVAFGSMFAVAYFSGLIYQQWRKRGKR
jgi:hypothetical protein